MSKILLFDMPYKTMTQHVIIITIVIAHSILLHVCINLRSFDQTSMLGSITS